MEFKALSLPGGRTFGDKKYVERNLTTDAMAGLNFRNIRDAGNETVLLGDLHFHKLVRNTKEKIGDDKA